MILVMDQAALVQDWLQKLARQYTTLCMAFLTNLSAINRTAKSRSAKKVRLR